MYVVHIRLVLVSTLAGVGGKYAPTRSVYITHTSSGSEEVLKKHFCINKQDAVLNIAIRSTYCPPHLGWVSNKSDTGNYG